MSGNQHTWLAAILVAVGLYLFDKIVPEPARVPAAVVVGVLGSAVVLADRWLPTTRDASLSVLAKVRQMPNQIAFHVIAATELAVLCFYELAFRVIPHDWFTAFIVGSLVFVLVVNAFRIIWYARVSRLRAGFVAA